MLLNDFFVVCFSFTLMWKLLKWNYMH